MKYVEAYLLSDEVKAAAKEVVELLRTKGMTVSEVHDLLAYIDQSIDHISVLK